MIVLLSNCFKGFTNMIVKEDNINFELIAEQVIDCQIGLNEIYYIQLEQHTLIGTQEMKFKIGLSQASIDYQEEYTKFYINNPFVVSIQYINEIGDVYDEIINLINSNNGKMISLTISVVILLIFLVFLILFLKHIYYRNKKRLKGNDYIMAKEHQKIMIHHQKRLRKLNPGFLVDFNEVQTLQEQNLKIY
ncbi:hypothetical protein SS50377_25625 [Spironucleus salmonicida]|uniref:Transmembrane protein n=1 Tax=Spironucleus salmonicida TaxID=348837 RepID=V6M7M8_9EUKA|nr:hypothetical protein SS50377_25625 [Spironucleus salmonicida]|eukprot:EST49474.1 Hypothetical protein SS50377_10223 [Spironucleus salmonicida]